MTGLSTLIHRMPPGLILLRTCRDKVGCRILISAAVSVQYQHATWHLQGVSEGRSGLNESFARFALSILLSLLLSFLEVPRK